MSSTVTTPAFRQDFFATIQRQAALLVIGIPLVMALWVAVANFWTLDVILTARAVFPCCLEPFSIHFSPDSLTGKRFLLLPGS